MDSHGARARCVPGIARAHLLARVRRSRALGAQDERARACGRDQSTDRDRPRPPRYGLGGVAVPRNGGDARRQRRDRRLAGAQRAVECIGRRHVGVGAPRRRRRHRLFAPRRHGRRRRRVGGGGGKARTRAHVRPGDRCGAARRCRLPGGDCDGELTRYTATDAAIVAAGLEPARGGPPNSGAYNALRTSLVAGIRKRAEGVWEMTGQNNGFERRVLSALESAPSRIPVVLGGCGSGRTMLLHRLRDRIGRTAAQYVDIERCATTPERFLQAVTGASPFPWHAADRQPATAREAFDILLAFLDTARAPGGEPCTFLLDEVLELRTFESFPGLRHVLRDLLEALAASANRFVLTTRYVARAQRLLRDATARFEVMQIPALAPPDVTESLAPAFNGYEQMPTDDRDYLGRAVQALTDGRAAYVRAIGDPMAAMGRGPDPG